MKSHIIQYASYLAIAFITIACTKSTPYVYRGMPKEYTSGWENIYGKCYDSVPYAVVALDLYSDGLELDSTHHMQGTGYNLCITDIFVPDRSGTKREHQRSGERCGSALRFFCFSGWIGLQRHTEYLPGRHRAVSGGGFL